MDEKREKYDFSNFKKVVRQSGKKDGVRIPYNSSYHYGHGLHGHYHVLEHDHDFTYEEIMDTIKHGDARAMRNLSRYFFRTNGIYKNSILMYAYLPTYDNVVVPFYDIEKKKSKDKMMSRFYAACDFVEQLDIPVTFARITEIMLVEGIYYGMHRVIDGKHTIQDLPYNFCRSRFRDYNGLDIPEINLAYFDTFKDEELKTDMLSSYPDFIQKAYRKRGEDTEVWVPIMPEDGGICFYLTSDKTPLLATSIPQLSKLSEALDREAQRDENELYKLLIQKMPIDSKGELVFQLDEVADIHASVADMLQNIDTVDVLTTFGDTSLEDLQDSTAASQSADRLAKYKNIVFDNLGVPALYFNPDTASGMAYSIVKDEAIVSHITSLYSTWIKLQINLYFARGNIKFDFIVLPITRHNKDKIQSQLFQGAQYGYSKLYAGVALGIHQKNLISLMDFENEILEMDEKMIPLMSSYTSSSKDLENLRNGNKNSNNNQGADDNNSEGGRPTLSDEQQSDSTAARKDVQ